MGIVHRMDRRRESRAQANFKVTIWGVDTKGDRFLQQAPVRDISVSGALLTGVQADLRSGDLIGILYRGKKARYRIIWVRHTEGRDEAQAAIQRVEPDECPWGEMLAEQTSTEDSQGNVRFPSDWA